MNELLIFKLQFLIKTGLDRVTVSDEAKSRTHFSVMFTLLNIGSRVARVVTFGKKIGYLWVICHHFFLI